MQKKYNISMHKQLPGEKMLDTYLRFRKILKKFPNHNLTKSHMTQDFYRSLNYITKTIVDVVCGGLFMRKTFSNRMQLLDEITRTTGLGTLEMQR